MLSIDLALVARRVDSAIHWITQLVLLLFIGWIVVYPVDIVIHLLNNRGLVILLEFIQHDYSHSLSGVNRFQLQIFLLGIIF